MKKLLFLLVVINVYGMDKSASESSIAIKRKKSEQRDREEICSMIFELYIDPHNRNIRPYLAPALHKKLHEYYYSKDPQKKRAIEFLRRFSDDEEKRTPSPSADIKQYIDRIVVEAVGDALKEKEDAFTLQERRLEIEMKKARLALLSNIGTAALTAASTALIFYILD